MRFRKNEGNYFAFFMSDINELIREDKVLLVQQLVTSEPKLVFKQDEDGRFPLHWAVSSGNLQIVDIILQVPKIDVDEMIDNSGWLPLHIASSIGNITIFDKLMNLTPQPDINLTTGQGTNCLLLAISKNHYNLVVKIIEQYKANVKSKDNFGRQGLHRASAIGSLPLVELLVGTNKIQINAKDNQGWTALHYAFAEGHGNVAVYLLAQGADISLQSSDGDTADALGDKATIDHVRDHVKNKTSFGHSD